jgi:hypothetical protein
MVKRQRDELGLSPPSISKVTARGAIPTLSHMTSSKPLTLLHRLENKHLMFMLLSVNIVYFIYKFNGFLTVHHSVDLNLSPT